jgi:N-acetylmuramoyl-L-alanine amidase
MAKANDFLIALDDGHGMETPGKRTPPIPQLGGRVIKENEFNRAVVNYLDAELKRCGFRTLLVAPTDEDTPLRVRTDKANAAGADFYISCHYNAGGGEGLETFHYPGSATGKRAAEIIHKHLMNSGVYRKNRGVKSANFHVLRETKMPAVLVEYGFMDDPGLDEAAQMIDPKVQKAFAVATAKGICEYFGVSYVPEKQPQPQKPSQPAKPQPAPAQSQPAQSQPAQAKPAPAHLCLTVPDGIIKMGDRGEKVKQLQMILNALGYNCGVPDGIFGKNTYNGLISFQQSAGIKIDGIYGSQTRNAILARISK